MRKSLSILACGLLLSLSSVAHATPSASPKTPNGTYLFVGDSYCGGIGASDVSLSFPYVLAKNAKVSLIVECEGGTGYWTSGSGYTSCGQKICLNYLSQLKQVSKSQVSKISVVLISGGKNDLGTPGVFQGSNYLSAVANTISYARMKFPTAKIVICDPFWDDTPIPAGEFWAEAQILSAAHAGNVIVVNGLIGLLQPSNGLLVINSHPNDAGHARIADAILNSLRMLGITPSRKG